MLQGNKSRLGQDLQDIIDNKLMLKIVLIVLGTISLILGILGIFVPGLPTTPFLLLTAGLYIKSSDRLYLWLTGHKYLGSYITNYNKNEGLSLKTKIYSIVLMWVMISISSYFFISCIAIKLVVIGLGIIGFIVMGFVVPTIKQ